MRAAWAWGGVLVLAACAGVTRGQEQEAVAWADVPSPVGREGPLLDAIADSLSSAASAVVLERDAFDSVIVRRAGDTSPVRLLIAVGVDEPCHAISQIRDDGLLRLRTLARGADEAFHLAREGRPVMVHVRERDVPGVLLVSSLHLRAPRPDVFDESSLYLDVGADSPADVTALGIELLDAVSMRESVRLAGSRMAGTSIGSRCLVEALARATSSAAQARNFQPGIAVAFVAQSQVGTGPLGRGGEAVVRRVKPAETWVLRVAEDLAYAVGIEPLVGKETDWKALNLSARHVGTPVELVDDMSAQVMLGKLCEGIGCAGDAMKGGMPSERLGLGDHGSDARSPATVGDNAATFDLLQRLVLSRGVSGHESPVRDAIRAQLRDINPAWQPVEDSAGNLVLTLGDGSKTFAFVAHMDEIGLEVTAVREDGLLETRRLGGMYEHLFRETVIELVTHEGKVLPGIALPRPEDTPEDEDPVILLDVGARSAAEAGSLGVAIGDAATVPKELNALGAHRVAGRSPDDRVGCTALLLALRELGPEADAMLRTAGRRVVFAWSTKEETGL